MTLIFGVWKGKTKCHQVGNNNFVDDGLLPLVVAVAVVLLLCCCCCCRLFLWRPLPWHRNGWRQSAGNDESCRMPIGAACRMPYAACFVNTADGISFCCVAGRKSNFFYFYFYFTAFILCINAYGICLHYNWTRQFSYANEFIYIVLGY